MKINNYLSLQRSFLYTKQYLTRNYITLLTGFILTFLVEIFFLYMFISHRGNNPNIKEGIEEILKLFFRVGLFALGFIFTSITFNDYQSKARKIWVLSLPVSILERVISMLLITTVCFATLYLPIFYAFETIIKTIVLSSNNLALSFDVLTKENLKLIGKYFVLQSLFLTGAAYFHKNSFIKTSLILVIFMILLTWLDHIILKNIYNITDYTFIGEVFHSETNQFALPIKAYTTIQTIGNIFFYIILAPVFWTITYLRLKEEEV